MQSRRHDLPREKFPFVIEAYHPTTKAIVWTATVQAPTDKTTSIYIPPLKERFGHPVGIRISFADGTIEDRPNYEP